MTMEEVEATYYVLGYYSSKDQISDAILAEDCPVNISISGCRYNTVGDGIVITFENDSTSSISELAFTKAEALRLVEKITERVLWSLSDVQNASKRPAQQGTLDTAPSNDVLIIGVRAIAKEIFDDKLDSRQVYRIITTDPSWPVFKLAGKWAARRNAMRAEIRRREQR